MARGGSRVLGVLESILMDSILDIVRDFVHLPVLFGQCGRNLTAAHVGLQDIDLTVLVLGVSLVGEGCIDSAAGKGTSG